MCALHTDNVKNTPPTDRHTVTLTAYTLMLFLHTHRLCDTV